MILMKDILLKLSGEAFGGKDNAFDQSTIHSYAKAICDGLAVRNRIYVVCGGGNVCRGRSFGGHVLTDYAGMLASIQNGLFLTIALGECGAKSALVVPDNFDIPTACHEDTIPADARVVIYAGGVGEPGHSTDYVCAVKSLEHCCDIYFAKFGCDGVYDRDPNGDDGENAVFFPEISFAQIEADNLKVIDLEAAQLLQKPDRAGEQCRGYIFALTAENISAMLCGNADAFRKTELI
ncbi:MAG: hypothetical protein IJ302_10360 [Clostridia bacterium]|nr:hypothetical protein [Clostridia bacterium]